MASTSEKGDAEDHKRNGELYAALQQKDEKKVIELCNNLPDGALHRLTMHNDTVLHMATSLGQVNLVCNLLEALRHKHLDKEVTRRDSSGNTILHEAATLDQEIVAEKMLNIAPHLLGETNELKETALFMAARYGKTDVFNFLADKVKKLDEATQRPFIQRNDNTTILHAAILVRHFEFNTQSCFATKSNSDPASELAKLLIEKTPFSSITDTKHKSSQDQFTKKGGNGEGKGDRKEDPTSSNSVTEEKPKPTPLFLATESGCTYIVSQILEKYPQAVEQMDPEGKTVLHVAIQHRQFKVFNILLTKVGGMRWLLGRLDVNENSILHMAAIKREHYVPGGLGGPVLALQDELLWFELVKSKTPPDIIDRPNKENKTVELLLDDSYKDLQKEATEWLRNAAQGCSVVAVLIATVAFAAAYTIPGGPSQNTGSPIFLNQPLFVVFIATDVLSVALALASVVMYVSILTSQFRLEDFKQSLPGQMTIGFTFMFLSVLFMMTAFAATIILITRYSAGWRKGFIYFLSFLPVGIFSLSWPPLYISLSRPFKNLPVMIKQAIARSLYFLEFWLLCCLDCLLRCLNCLCLCLFCLQTLPCLLYLWDNDGLSTNSAGPKSEIENCDSSDAPGPQNPDPV